MSFCTGLKVRPTVTFGTSFGHMGGFQVETFNEVKGPLEVVSVLVEALNHRLAMNTWKTYKNAENHVGKIQHKLGISLMFLFSLAEK